MCESIPKEEPVIETEQLIQCQECGKLFKRITETHLKKCCDIDLDGYKRKHYQYLYFIDWKNKKKKEEK